MKRSILNLMVVVVMVAASAVRAQEPGGEGTYECRKIQLEVQVAVAGGGQYKNHGQLVSTVTHRLGEAVTAGEITDECTACVITQFARGFPTEEQTPCGPDAICGDHRCQGETLYSCPGDCGGTTVIAHATDIIPRFDLCAQQEGLLCESLLGDVTTDAMRLLYDMDFAITNTGALRGDLTCPVADDPTDSCPSYSPPPFPITRYQVVEALPLGYSVATLTVNGAELKTILENGVSAMPDADSRFAQVSGLCVTYDIAAPAGSRVLRAVRHVGAGLCNSAPIDLTTASTYTIAENSFMVRGGDGYPDFSSRAALRDTMDEVVSGYVAAGSPISQPPVLPRINCVSTGTSSCPPMYLLGDCALFGCPPDRYCAQCLYGRMCLGPGEGCI